VEQRETNTDGLSLMSFSTIFAIVAGDSFHFVISQTSIRLVEDALRSIRYYDTTVLASLTGQYLGGF
jgi:hypothetical protein